ncbi:hypothetical protein ACNKHP_23750 [Shigella boydii]
MRLDKDARRSLLIRSEIRSHPIMLSVACICSIFRHCSALPPPTR